MKRDKKENKVYRKFWWRFSSKANGDIVVIQSLTLIPVATAAVCVCVCVGVCVCGCVGVCVWVCGGVCECTPLLREVYYKASDLDFQPRHYARGKG